MKTLRIFPNTGHEIFSVDLEELLSQRRDPRGVVQPPPSMEDLMRFVNLQHPTNLSPQQRQKFAGWQPWAEEVPWLLYQYDVLFDPDRGEDRPVLLLAIESNLGDLGRGSILSLERTSEDARPSGNPFSAVRESAKATEPAGTVSPYLSRDENQLYADYPSGEMFLEDPFGGGRVRLPSKLDPRIAKDLSFELPPETVRIQWVKSAGDKPVDVDLIVDLGNTRTIALMLEDHGAAAHATEFSARAHAVRFLPGRLSFSSRDARENVDDYAMIDSWVLVHRASFANLEPPASNEKIRIFAARSAGDLIRARLLDQRFVSTCPVLVGGGRAPTGAAKTLARAVLSDDQQAPRFYLSSPKRYAWDDASIGSVDQFWEQIPNEYDVDAGQFKPMEGLIRILMHPDGPEFDLPLATLDSDAVMPLDNITIPAKYPRRDTICWFALGILEAAYRQMNACDFLDGKARPKVVRRLRNIRVTYPSGWTGQEREAYFSQWRRAARLFAQAHCATPLTIHEGGEGPALVSRHLDEAVSSQLPILNTELANLGHDANAWFDLFGPQGHVTVMNIDIGGGTTDVAVIRYLPTEPGTRGGAALKPELLFKDGYTVAGDSLVKRLIENVVLPTWLGFRGGSHFAGNREAREIVVKLLNSAHQNPVNNYIPGAMTRLGRIVRLVFVPLANSILGRLTQTERDGEVGIRPFRVDEVADSTAIRELNSIVMQLIVRHCDASGWGRHKPTDLRRLRNPGVFRRWFDGIWSKSEHWNDLPFRPDAEIQAHVDMLNGSVNAVFGGMIADLAEVIAENECNLVIVSGKPSELPQIRRLVSRELPLPAQRIIQVKDYAVGAGYPADFVDSGRIRDAKTVTVAGAALFQDILNGNTGGFQLIEDPQRPTAALYHWGVMLANRDPVAFRSGVLFEAGTPSGRRREVELRLGDRLGRSMRLSERIRPEPVYRLELRTDVANLETWLPKDFNRAETSARFLLEFSIKADVGECLEIVPGTLVLFSNGVTVPIDAAPLVRLKLCTMVDDTFWLDAPTFEIDGQQLFASSVRHES